MIQQHGYVWIRGMQITSIFVMTANKDVSEHIFIYFCGYCFKFLIIRRFYFQDGSDRVTSFNVNSDYILIEHHQNKTFLMFSERTLIKNLTHFKLIIIIFDKICCRLQTYSNLPQIIGRSKRTWKPNWICGGIGFHRRQQSSLVWRELSSNAPGARVCRARGGTCDVICNCSVSIVNN